MEIKKISDYKYLIPKSGKMNVDGLIFADDEMIQAIKTDQAHIQVANVATLKGIYKAALAMPDIHYGYGFPIGGVAAFDADEGVISPGGIGYDINCGVRLLRTNLIKDDVNKQDIERVCDDLYKNVPSGVGRTGKIK